MTRAQSAGMIASGNTITPRRSGLLLVFNYCVYLLSSADTVIFQSKSLTTVSGENVALSPIGLANGGVAYSAGSAVFDYAIADGGFQMQARSLFATNSSDPTIIGTSADVNLIILELL